MLRWKITDTLHSVAVPALVLTGSRDIVTLPTASRTIAAALVDASLVEVKGCGHMGFMERHETYNSEIASFSERVIAPLRTT